MVLVYKPRSPSFSASWTLTMKSTLINLAIKRSIRRKINVRMLADNSIINVKPGFMRNTLYPARLAEYLDFDMAVREGVVNNDMKDINSALKPSISASTSAYDLNTLHNQTIQINRSTIDTHRIHGSISLKDIQQILLNDYQLNTYNNEISVDIQDDDRLINRNQTKLIKAIGEYKLVLDNKIILNLVVNSI